jgi:hypothetical protein
MAVSLSPLVSGRKMTAFHEILITGQLDTLRRFLAWAGPKFQPPMEYSPALPSPSPGKTYVVRMDRHKLTVMEPPGSPGWRAKKKHLVSLLGKVFPRLCHGGKPFRLIV